MQLEQYSKATLETAVGLRIIDDSLWRLVAAKQNVCQEILRTLLDMPKLKVVKVNVQEVIQSLHREITIDALCILDDGSICNIEMQKGDGNDDIKRTRFHASSITAKYTPKGTDFENIPNVTILYITQYDALKNNRTITHVSRCMNTKNGKYVPINDGEDIVFANTEVKEASDKSELLQLMLRKDAFYSDKFPATSKAINYFKNTKGGMSKVCKSVELYAENYAKKYAENYAKEVAKEYFNNGRIKTITDFLSNGGSKADAKKMLNASAKEIKEAEARLIK